ncbi:hypothetical protein [Cryptosporangium minutisporangium]|uniref:Uncharacterized protein n=1 Tax=Cryptosporangium minutisporangium TaxID=113569 RepID=A0ABP6SY11_9ACTN
MNMPKRARRLAERERRAERHAALVVERTGDPNEALTAAAERSGDEYLIALVRAAVEVGYFVTEENERLYSVQEVEDYEAALSRHLDQAPCDPCAEYCAEATEQLYEIISALVAGTAGATAARSILELPERVSEEADDEAGAAAYTAVLRCALVLLFAARRAGIDEVDLRDATAWVDGALGREYARLAAVVAIPVCSVKDPVAQQELYGKSGELTVGDLLDTLGDEVVPAMIWLAAGLVATVGDRYVHWLRQVVLESLEDDDS